MRHGTSCTCGGSGIRNIGTDEDGTDHILYCECGGLSGITADAEPHIGGESDRPVTGNGGPAEPFDVAWNHMEQGAEEEIRRLER